MLFRNYKIRRSHEKTKTEYNCVGERYYLATLTIEGDITKTGRKTLIGKRAQFIMKNSLKVNDNTKQAESLDRIIKNLGKKVHQSGQKLATNVIKDPGRALKNWCKKGTAAGAKILKPFYLLSQSL